MAKVNESYPDLNQVIQGHSLSVVKGKNEIISYVTKVNFNSSGDLGNPTLRNEITKIMSEFIFKFGPVADQLG
jgi:hypothetical protein